MADSDGGFESADEDKQPSTPGTPIPAEVDLTTPVDHSPAAVLEPTSAAEIEPNPAAVLDTTPAPEPAPAPRGGTLRSDPSWQCPVGSQGSGQSHRHRSPVGS